MLVFAPAETADTGEAVGTDLAEHLEVPIDRTFTTNDMVLANDIGMHLRQCYGVHHDRQRLTTSDHNLNFRVRNLAKRMGLGVVFGVGVGVGIEIGALLAKQSGDEAAEELNEPTEHVVHDLFSPF